MDGPGEVCLEAEVEKLWRSGMEPEEIARTMGVDVSWVEALISAQEREPGAAPGRE
jgi:hypothetical protein